MGFPVEGLPLEGVGISPVREGKKGLGVTDYLTKTKRKVKGPCL
jgi:hypothetical protein